MGEEIKLIRTHIQIIQDRLKWCENKIKERYENG
jgi:hypothetical protein